MSFFEWGLSINPWGLSINFTRFECISKDFTRVKRIYLTHHVLLRLTFNYRVLPRLIVKSVHIFRFFNIKATFCRMKFAMVKSVDFYQTLSALDRTRSSKLMTAAPSLAEVEGLFLRRLLRILSSERLIDEVQWRLARRSSSLSSDSSKSVSTAWAGCDEPSSLHLPTEIRRRINIRTEQGTRSRRLTMPRFLTSHARPSTTPFPRLCSDPGFQHEMSQVQ